MLDNRPDKISRSSWWLLAQLGKPERCGLWALFSPDSRRLAYVSYIDDRGRSAVVLDGVEGHAHEGILSYGYGFSEDSSRFAYVARTGKQGSTVVDGTVGRLYPAVLPNTIRWSPDARDFSYVATTGDGATVVVNETESKPFDRIVNGSDGIVFDGPGRMHYIGLRGAEALLVEEILAR